MHSFRAVIEIIGVNPYVRVPEHILTELYASAGKTRGPIPIKGTVNGQHYSQTLVRYAGEWRLYINTTMLKQSPRHVGETIDITLEYDPNNRVLPLHDMLAAALANDTHAKQVYDSLPPSHRHEINRYISRLKSEEIRQKNVEQALAFLHEKKRYLGRDPNV